MQENDDSNGCEMIDALRAHLSHHLLHIQRLQQEEKNIEAMTKFVQDSWQQEKQQLLGLRAAIRESCPPSDASPGATNSMLLMKRRCVRVSARMADPDDAIPKNTHTPRPSPIERLKKGSNFRFVPPQVHPSILDVLSTTPSPNPSQTRPEIAKRWLKCHESSTTLPAGDRYPSQSLSRDSSPTAMLAEPLPLSPSEVGGCASQETPPPPERVDWRSVALAPPPRDTPHVAPMNLSQEADAKGVVGGNGAELPLHGSSDTHSTTCVQNRCSQTVDGETCGANLEPSSTHAPKPHPSRSTSGSTSTPWEQQHLEQNSGKSHAMGQAQHVCTGQVRRRSPDIPVSTPPTRVVPGNHPFHPPPPPPPPCQECVRMCEAFGVHGPTRQDIMRRCPHRLFGTPDDPQTPPEVWSLQF